MSRRFLWFFPHLTMLYSVMLDQVHRKVWKSGWGKKLIQQSLNSSPVWRRFCFYFCQNLERGVPQNPATPTRSDGPARYSCCSDICWCSKKVMLEFRIACEAKVSADFKTSRNFILTHVLAKPLNLSISGFSHTTF